MLGYTVYLTEVNDSYVATAYKISCVLENEKYIAIYFFHYSFKSFQLYLFI